MRELLTEYERRYPSIEWREPVYVEVPGMEPRWACRVCIANYGLAARELHAVDFAFEERADAEAHIFHIHLEGSRE